MTKKIYLEPAWKMHSLHQTLIDYPPPGYEFIAPRTSQEKIFKAAGKVNFSYTLAYALDRVVPMNLAMAYVGKFGKIPSDVALTYSHSHLVFRKEPWIVDLELVTLLAGFSVKHFTRNKRIIERAFASEHCKRILCETEAARKAILHNLDCSRFERKLETLPLSVAKRNSVKNFKKDKVKLLFVSSANILGEFEIKGGREALEAFALLNKKYDNLELVIRSDVPKDIKAKCLGYNNIKLIEERIPWAALEQEFQTADIFFLPAHNTPFLVFLDAMSYELPVVTIDVWANSEIVEDGKTGFLVSKSDKIPYYIDNFIPNFGSAQFQKALRSPDPRVVAELVEKTSFLIENEELRRQMGRNGRWEVEHGKYSIEKRNEKLKRIFDETTA